MLCFDTGVGPPVLIWQSRSDVLGPSLDGIELDAAVFATLSPSAQQLLLHSGAHLIEAGLDKDKTIEVALESVEMSVSASPAESITVAEPPSMSGSRLQTASVCVLLVELVLFKVG
jgi:hypothetical protein